jgi:hypothetical protein
MKVFWLFLFWLFFKFFSLFLFIFFIFLGNNIYANSSNIEAMSVQLKIERENLKNEIEEINRKIGN